jgi:hypothetical protein
MRGRRLTPIGHPHPITRPWSASPSRRPQPPSWCPASSGAQLHRHAVFEVFQIAGKIRPDLFDLLFHVDLEFFYISLEIGDVSFRGQVLFDQFRSGVGQGLGLLLGEPGPLRRLANLRVSKAKALMALEIFQGKRESPG